MSHSKKSGCNEKEIHDIFTFIVNIYLKKEEHDSKYNDVCSFCPKPVYTLTVDLRSYRK